MSESFRIKRIAGIMIAFLAENWGASWAAECPFTERVIPSSVVGPISVHAADLDDDGDTDVLSASQNDNKIAWYENDGASTPQFIQRDISSNAIEADTVFAADLDGDLDIDVLSASQEDDTIAWYENDGQLPPNFIERIISTNANEAVGVFAADLDSDDDIDVLSASELDDKIAWYENNGASPPNFVERVISTNADGAWSVFATDVDRDGDTDVLSASREDDKIAWYENDGASPPSFFERVISSTANRAWSVFAIDVDGDGDTDVLSASFDDDKIAWYESNGTLPPTFSEHVISTAADCAEFVFAVDLDSDGDSDVLSASACDDKIAWYENDRGAPPSFTEHVISTIADNAVAVFGTDVDGDGDTDVLSASPHDHKIAWYENRDLDGDGVCDSEDNCPNTPNPSQNNSDPDPLGDACDPCIDPNNSGVCIPTISEWGLLAMGLLTVAAGTVVMMQRRTLEA